MPLVLIAEDDPEIAAFARLRLEFDGHRIVVAPDGEAALDLSRRLHPDLIVLDWELPGLSGEQVCRRLRYDQALAMMPVLAAGSAGPPHETDAILAAGADDFLTTPFGSGELSARVGALLKVRGGDHWSLPQPLARRLAAHQAG